MVAVKLTSRHATFLLVVAVAALSLVVLMRNGEAEASLQETRAHREVLTVPSREMGYKQVDPLEQLKRAAAAENNIAAQLSSQVNLLVSIISGGSNETLKRAAYRPSYFLNANKERAGNREAVLRTWATEKTFFVTNEAVDTDRVIHLKPEFELGGRDGLPNKVKGMWQHLYEHYNHDSNWIMKGKAGPNAWKHCLFDIAENLKSTASAL